MLCVNNSLTHRCCRRLSTPFSFLKPLSHRGSPYCLGNAEDERFWIHGNVFGILTVREYAMKVSTKREQRITAIDR